MDRHCDPMVGLQVHMGPINSSLCFLELELSFETLSLLDFVLLQHLVAIGCHCSTLTSCHLALARLCLLAAAVVAEVAASPAAPGGNVEAFYSI